MKKEHKKVIDFLNEAGYAFGTNTWDNQVIQMEKDDGEGTLATFGCDKMYRRNTIRIYPNFYKQTKEDQALALIHELCHFITNDMKTDSLNLLEGRLVTGRERSCNMEATTEWICRILWTEMKPNSILQNAIKKYLK